MDCPGGGEGEAGGWARGAAGAEASRGPGRALLGRDCPAVSSLGLDSPSGRSPGWGSPRGGGCPDSAAEPVFGSPSPGHGARACLRAHVCRGPSKGKGVAGGECVQIRAVHVHAGTGLRAWRRPVYRPAGVHVCFSAARQDMRTPGSPQGRGRRQPQSQLRAPGTRVAGRAGSVKGAEAALTTVPPPRDLSCPGFGCRSLALSLCREV